LAAAGVQQTLLKIVVSAQVSVTLCSVGAAPRALASSAGLHGLVVCSLSTGARLGFPPPQILSGSFLSPCGSILPTKSAGPISLVRRLPVEQLFFMYSDGFISTHGFFALWSRCVFDWSIGVTGIVLESPDQKTQEVF
jgi:hypothetical protein